MMMFNDNNWLRLGDECWLFIFFFFLIYLLLNFLFEFIFNNWRRRFGGNIRRSNLFLFLSNRFFSKCIRFVERIKRPGSKSKLLIANRTRRRVCNSRVHDVRRPHELLLLLLLLLLLPLLLLPTIMCSKLLETPYLGRSPNESYGSG